MSTANSKAAVANSYVGSKAPFKTSGCKVAINATITATRRDKPNR